MESVIGANAVRFSRLTADGTPDFLNAVGGLVVCGGISTFEFDFETEAGSSIFVRDAAGNPCVNRKRRDDVKFTTFTLTMCRTDWRLTEIALEDGAELLTDDQDYPVGVGILTSRGCGEAATGNGVCIELWSELFDCDAPAEPFPYVRTVLPKSFLTPKGHRREDGVSLPVYSGFSVTNANILNGPFDDFDVNGDLTNKAFFEFGDSALPTCDPIFDYVALPAS